MTLDSAGTSEKTRTKLIEIVFSSFRNPAPAPAAAPYIYPGKRERGERKKILVTIFCASVAAGPIFLFVRPLFSHLFFPIRLSAGAPLN
jgi:hypothetical protein